MLWLKGYNPCNSELKTRDIFIDSKVRSAKDRQIDRRQMDEWTNTDKQRETNMETSKCLLPSSMRELVQRESNSCCAFFSSILKIIPLFRQRSQGIFIYSNALPTCLYQIALSSKPRIHKDSNCVLETNIIHKHWAQGKDGFQLFILFSILMLL